LVPWAVSGISTLDALLTVVFMIGGENQHAGQLAMGTGSRLHAHRR
jgi:hypothetical protein